MLFYTIQYVMNQQERFLPACLLCASSYSAGSSNQQTNASWHGITKSERNVLSHPCPPPPSAGLTGSDSQRLRELRITTAACHHLRRQPPKCGSPRAIQRSHPLERESESHSEPVDVRQEGTCRIPA